MELDISERSLPVYAALASKTRLKLINFIGNDTKSMGEIAEYLGISNAITTRHVRQLEDAGLLSSERGTGKDRNKKLVWLNVDSIHISFPEKIYKALECYTSVIKLGHFTDFYVAPTCGIATTKKIIGKTDEPKYFMDSERINASLIWLGEGYLEYKIPNMVTCSHHLKKWGLPAQSCQCTKYQQANPACPAVFTNGISSVPWIFYAQKELGFRISFLCATSYIQLSMYMPFQPV